MRILLILGALIAGQILAFVPPVTSILKDIFDSRKISDGTEFAFSYQILNTGGDAVEIEERILVDSSGLKFLWKVGPQGSWLTGKLEKRAYIVGVEQKIPARSLLFLKYFVSKTAVEFRDALVNERFLRWEQLKQYKDGFELQGDPQTWEIKKNYVQQDSVFFALLPSGPSLAVVGHQDSSSKKTFYLDKDSLTVKRFDWADSVENLTWNLGSSSLEFKGAIFPKSAVFSKNGKELINAELVVIRQLNKKQLKEWLQLWQRTNGFRGAATTSEDNLRTLLSNR